MRTPTDKRDGSWPMNRRDWLRISTAGMVAGSASGWFDQLAARAAESNERKRACILLWMNGGPSQMDLFDPKPALEKYAGQRPEAANLRTERTTGGLLPSPFQFQRHGDGFATGHVGLDIQV